MGNATSRGRTTGSPARRTMTAAARAAAKRAKRTEHVKRPEGPLSPEAPLSGPTMLVEPSADGWDDPPEPSPQCVEQDPESLAEPEGSAPPQRSARRRLTAVLGVLLVAGLVAVAVLGWQYTQGRRTEDARAEALMAARKAAPVVLSYDYRHLDRDFARARDRLTGHFRDEYRKTTTRVVGPTARKYHAVVKATVAEPASGGSPAASVVSASADKAVVLLFVNQVTESTQVSGSRLDLNRVRMTMTHASAGWKVSDVDAL
ncbi:hypothetical protein [Streptomyces durhamensis]|uniref:hypothetical protein n=1 Tax=Streptomyces durhamensis TaxID=68194 RepID=UPI0004CD0F88|nr:hypothetical protein [Streptomyces durhamensis]